MIFLVSSRVGGTLVMAKSVATVGCDCRIPPTFGHSQ